MKSDILTNWYNSLDLKDSELQSLHNCERCDDKDTFDKSFYPNLVNMLFNRAFHSNLDRSHWLRLSECATNLINQVFECLYDENSIVLSTMQEHTNVLKILENKNVHYVDFQNDTEETILESCKCAVNSYNKIIVYMSGTQIKTGRVIDNSFFYNLKKCLGDKEIYMILDDVQGMFMIPRSYRQFDFVIGTAHSLIEGYDTGFVILKKEILGRYNIGVENCRWISDYLPLLDIMIKRRQQIGEFHAIMEEYCHDLVCENNFKIYDKQANHIFSFDCNKIPFTSNMESAMNKYRISIDSVDGSMRPQTSIRFRAQEVIKYFNIFDEGFTKLQILINQLMRNQ